MNRIEHPARFATIAIALCLSLIRVDLVVADETVESDLAAVLDVRPDGVGHIEARAASARLSELPSGDVARILDGMAGASPLAKNWLRVIAGSVADNGEFPKPELLAFLADRDRDADARFLAFQMLTVRQPESLPSLIEGAETDPSLPLRHLAISRLLDQATGETEAGNNAAAVEALKIVLAEGRNPDQLKAAADALEKLGQPVDLAEELALVRRWWVLATYPNTDSRHFDTAYLPETVYVETGRLPADWLAEGAAIRRGEPAGDASAGQVARVVSTADSLGMVDLNAPLENAKDAIAYAYAEFHITQAGAAAAEGDGKVAAEARLGCINANKVWVNGELVTANEVYHSGSRIDQYVGDCELVPGVNTVLVKICQNAQTEAWAQDWGFQFRLTDPAGAAIPVTLIAPAPSAE
jgi:hypothetical protein